jgi:hyperosmotically inducible periplasmic protein
MRALLRALLVIALLLVVGFVVIGYWTGAPWLSTITAPLAASRPAAAPETTRERGAELGEKAAQAAQEVGNAVDDAAITAKIKAKMTLDDSVRARAVDVSTTGSTVTPSGTVRSVAEHNRAITLARETDGVTRVVDHLVLRP